MIKLILPDREKYSYKYDKDLSVKEVLNNFCKEKGLLADIYEAYNPKLSKSLDCNKKLFEYNLNSLHLRRRIQSKSRNLLSVDPNISSNQDLPEKIVSINSDTLWNEQTLQKYSQNSFNQIKINKNECENKNKKSVKNFFRRLKVKKQTLTRSYSENLESPVDNQILTLSTDKIYQDSVNSNSVKTELKVNAKIEKKIKRLAPPPPTKNVLTFSCENGDSKFKSIDLEIPQPPLPSTELIGHYNYYPWQSCVECHTGNDSLDEESIYSIIPENHTPFPVSNSGVIEPPKCPTPNVSDEEIENENYVYSKIQKNIVINNIFESNIENTNTNQFYLHTNNQLSSDNNAHVLYELDSPISNTNNSISILSVSSESEGSSISSSSNANFLRNQRVPISTIDLSNSLNRIKVDVLTIDKLSLTSEKSENEFNLKSHQKRTSLKTSPFKSTETENVLHDLKNSSNPLVKEFSENVSISSDKTFPISKTNKPTESKNTLDKEKLNLTANNEISIVNIVRSSPKPVYRYKYRTTNKVINSLKNLDNYSTKRVSLDGSIKVEKQGGSLYFSAMHD